MARPSPWHYPVVDGRRGVGGLRLRDVGPIPRGDPGVSDVGRTGRRVERIAAMTAAVSLGAALVPALKLVAFSLALGLIVGGLNHHLLLSGLRRVFRLHRRSALGAFQVAGLVRIGLVVGLIYWASQHGPHLAVLPLLVGLFIPEVLFVALWYGRTKEESH